MTPLPERFLGMYDELRPTVDGLLDALADLSDVERRAIAVACARSRDGAAADGETRAARWWAHQAALAAEMSDFEAGVLRRLFPQPVAELVSDDEDNGPADAA